MRDATNQEGYHVQYLGEDGWESAQIDPADGRAFVYTKDDANRAFRFLKRLIPGSEFRIYPALKL